VVFDDADLDSVVEGVVDAINPARTGTKVAAHHVLEVEPGASASIRMRLSPAGASGGLGADFDVVDARRREADAFYATVIPPSLSTDEAMVMRQALGCCGASSTTSTTCTAGCASTASIRGTHMRPAVQCATSAGSTWSPAT
jgi:hypothetical protein